MNYEVTETTEKTFSPQRRRERKENLCAFAVNPSVGPATPFVLIDRSHRDAFDEAETRYDLALTWVGEIVEFVQANAM